MKRSRFVAFAAVAGLSAGLCSGLMPLGAKPLAYKLPKETAAFKPGPNLDVVRNNCTGCHSADYIATQPRGPKYREDFWKAEVNKMINLYGAPIEQADIGKIVDYLARTYQD